MNLLSLSIKNLSRRRTRSALTIVGLAVAIAAVVSLVGVVTGYRQAMFDLYESSGTDLVVFRKAGAARASLAMDEKLGEKIRRLPGVRAVSSSLADTVAFVEQGLYGVVLQGLPWDSYVLKDKKILAGRKMKRDDGRVVMLGKIMARNLDKKVGDTLEVIEGEPFKVVGIFQSFSFLENNIIVLPIDQVQKLFSREGEVTGFVVVSSYDDEESIKGLCEQIRALSPLIDAQPTREFFDTAIEARIAQAMAWLTSTIALLVGVIGMLNTMWMAVVERTQEIALLRAIGWRKRMVVKLILTEALSMALAGALVGTLLAIALTQVLSRFPAVEPFVSREIHPTIVIQALGIALLVSFVGGSYPAYRAARLKPTEGLHYE
jgi:putative ABC transport system permease protein